MAKTKSPPGPIEVIERMRALDDTRSEAEADQNKLLRDLGWTYTSSNPCSVWLWEKVLPDGRTAIVDTHTAMMFEERWAEFALPNDYDPDA